MASMGLIRGLSLQKPLTDALISKPQFGAIWQSVGRGGNSVAPWPVGSVCVGGRGLCSAHKNSAGPHGLPVKWVGNRLLEAPT